MFKVDDWIEVKLNYMFSNISRAFLFILTLEGSSTQLTAFLSDYYTKNQLVALLTSLIYADSFRLPSGTLLGIKATEVICEI